MFPSHVLSIGDEETIGHLVVQGEIFHRSAGFFTCQSGRQIDDEMKKKRQRKNRKAVI